MRVAENLNFNVARVLQVFFEINRIVAEIGLGFRPGARIAILEFTFGMDDLHAFTAAAAGCLDQNGEAHFLGDGDTFLGGFQTAFRTRHNRQTEQHQRVTESQARERLNVTKGREQRESAAAGVAQRAALNDFRRLEAQENRLHRERVNLGNLLRSGEEVKDKSGVARDLRGEFNQASDELARIMTEKYNAAERAGMAAPKVLAKGMGEIALRIRSIGAENGVPMLEAPPLARALYRNADLDQEIPSTLYAAVAEVLAYVYQLTNWRKVGGAYPQPPREIVIPAELAVEAVNG